MKRTNGYTALWPNNVTPTAARALTTPATSPLAVTAARACGVRCAKWTCYSAAVAEMTE